MAGTQKKMLLMRKKGLISKIFGWQNSQIAQTLTGGYGTLAGAGVLAGAAAGTWSTFISDVVGDSILQDGFINYAVARILQVGDVNQRIKFKVFRYNGSTYDMISQSNQFTIPGTGNQSFIFASPIACRIGDIVGFAVTGGSSSANRVRVGYSILGSMRTPAVQADITTSDGFATVTAVTINVQFYSKPPYLTVTGDSIAEGHTTYHSVYHTGPSGTIAHEIMHEMRLLIGDGTIFQYQNRALGGTTYAWSASTGVPAAIATKAKVIIIHAGVNDVSTGRAWAESVGDLDTIKGLVKNATPVPKLYVDEVLPWTAGNDTLAEVVRSFNNNLATWCSINGVTLIRSHDAMGKIRASTGYLDDLATAYDDDEVHLTQAGVDKMATIWKGYL
jgi:lysophospholipase L1-like esterase